MSAIKINLGSGFLGLDGWLNYDNSMVARLSRHPLIIKILVQTGALPDVYANIKWPPIVLHDCRKGIPLETNSVDFIYTSHFLEHLYRHETVGLLKECLRVLKPSGTIRIVLPDLAKFVQIYLAGEKSAYQYLTTIADPVPVAADLFAAAFFTSEFNRNKQRGLVAHLRELFLRHHQWMYDVHSMTHILKHVGFGVVEEMDYQKSSLAETSSLDTLPEISFFIEARKL